MELDSGIPRIPRFICDFDSILENYQIRLVTEQSDGNYGTYRGILDTKHPVNEGLLICATTKYGIAALQIINRQPEGAALLLPPGVINSEYIHNIIHAYPIISSTYIAVQQLKHYRNIAIVGWITIDTSGLPRIQYTTSDKYPIAADGTMYIRYNDTTYMYDTNIALGTHIPLRTTISNNGFYLYDYVYVTNTIAARITSMLQSRLQKIL